MRPRWTRSPRSTSWCARTTPGTRRGAADRADRADGAPQNSVVWIKREGDTVLFSSTASRQKVRNLQRDPRISLSFFDLANPYTSVEIRGTVEILPDENKRLPYELSHKYLGIDPPAEKDDEVRVIIRVVPQKIVGFSA
ncbi:PPOX class F420-dependent oxidoreductase [Streptomyces avermitilis]|uniref:PPOX class F420-dependent oxidoreductase n=1 Tax=Streptomyces avermitilis TaxID=33903 RepID=UPI0033A4E5BD